MVRRITFAACALLGASVTSLASTAVADPLTAEQRTQRCADIRDVAADNGISAGYLFTGIAQAETNLSHCWEELDWACQGPASVDCGGGPVVAGAGDGACSLMQGGLGMFQFDGGTFDDTIQRDGDGVLLLSGNVTRAVDFVVNMVMGSVYVDADVSTPELAKAWMNSVVVDGAGWTEWIQTVTHYYNGCSPSGCSVYDERFQHYADAGADVYWEQGEDFWVVDVPPCAPIPADGRLLEETDTCFEKGGPLPYWRVGIGGESNLHVWTSTTDLDVASNYARWELTFDEAGDYLVEVSVAAGTSTQTEYLITHGGGADQVVIDQGASDGYVELGVFPFEAGPAQSVYVGDDTGILGEKLAIDAIRLTRIGGGGTGGGGGGDVSGSGGDATDTVGAGVLHPGDGGDESSARAGAGGSSPSAGGGGTAGDSAADGDSGSGCDCATRPGARDERGSWSGAVVVAFAAAAWGRRRRDARR